MEFAAGQGPPHSTSTKSWKANLDAARAAAAARAEKGAWHQYDFGSLENSLVCASASEGVRISCARCIAPQVGSTLERWRVKGKGCRVRRGESLDSPLWGDIDKDVVVVTAASAGAKRLRIESPPEFQGGWVSSKSLRKDGG